MVSFSGDLKDPDVVVSGLEFGYNFDVFDGDAIFLGLGLVGLLRFGCYCAVLKRLWKGFEVCWIGMAGNLNCEGGDKRSNLEWG